VPDRLRGSTPLLGSHVLVPFHPRTHKKKNIGNTYIRERRDRIGIEDT
jgi:hypothetical protein